MIRDLIFISYSRKDAKWLAELQTMMKPLAKTLPIEIWDDTKIEVGQQWRPEIELALARAYIAVLLVSQHFLESDFIAEHELPPLLEAAEQGGLTVVCLHVSHCLHEETEIGKYQAVNDPAQTLDLLSPGKRNKLLAETCRAIKVLALQNRELTSD
jgi:TIR domain